MIGDNDRLDNMMAVGGRLSMRGNVYAKAGPLRRKPSGNGFSPNAQYAMRHFMNKGLAPYQAAGLVGNLMRESGLNPSAVNPSSKAYGLAQWLGARKRKLFSMYGSSPSLQNQLDFVWWELNNTHKNGLKYLATSRNAEEAARAGMNWFEFSNGDAVSEMNRWGQDGRGSMRKGIEFASRLAGQPMPDLAYLDTPRNQQMPMASQMQQPMGYQPQYSNDIPAFMPLNPEALDAPLASYVRPSEQREPAQPLVDIAQQEALLRQQESVMRTQEAQDRRDRLGLLLSIAESMNPSEDNSFTGLADMLSWPLTLGRVSAYGGRIYDGTTEPSNWMQRTNPRYLSEQVTVEGRNAKVLDADYDRNTATVLYDDGTTEKVRPAKDFWIKPNNVILGSKELKDNQYRTMPTNAEANAFADAWTEQTAPTVSHLIAAGLKPLDLVTPSRYVGLLDSDNKNGFLHLFDDDNRGFYINNNPNGLFNKKFHDEHPIIAGIGNMAFDIPTGIAAGWTIGKGLNAAGNAYNAGKNIFATYKEISPELSNMVADRFGLPELKGFVNKKGQYYESRFNPFKNKTLEESLLEEGYFPTLRGGERRLFIQNEVPNYHFSKTNSGTGVTETIGVNPYKGGRINHYNVSARSPIGEDMGEANIRRMSYGYNAPGNYKVGNQFDLALTAGTTPTVDKNVLKTFGAGMQRLTPKGAKITGDGAPSIADRVLSNLESKHYWDALKLATRRPLLPTYNALSTDSYRYLVGYGNKYPGFVTFYDGYSTGFNNAGVKYTNDINLLRTSPENLNSTYLYLDENYPGITNGQLPHPWIKKK